MLLLQRRGLGAVAAAAVRLVYLVRLPAAKTAAAAEVVVVM
jgi:hypothetical protein